MTSQLATRISSNKKRVLDALHKKTRLSYRHLTETAIALLNEYYTQLERTYKKGGVDIHFLNLLDKSIERYHKTYEKLAK